MGFLKNGGQAERCPPFIACPPQTAVYMHSLPSSVRQIGPLVIIVLIVESMTLRVGEPSKAT